MRIVYIEMKVFIELGAVIKDVCSQGVLPMQTLCGQGGSLDEDVRIFWCKKLQIFVSARKGREEVERTFKNMGINFSRFFADVFYGRSLITRKMHYKLSAKCLWIENLGTV